MHVVIAGPCELAPLARLVDRDSTDLPPGMPGISVLSLVTTLIDLGHFVTLVTLDPTVEREVQAEGARLRIRVGRYRATRRARDFFRLEREQVSRAIAGEHADVVHAQWTYEYALGALATTTPTLVTVRDWGPAILRYHPHPYRLVRLLMQLETFRRRPHLTAVSPYMQRRVQALVRNEVALIPNGIRDAVFDAPPPDRSVEQSPLVVAVNQGWSARKNVSALLHAFASVLERHSDARLALVGTGYGPGEAAEAWASQRGFADNVAFLGALGNVDAVEWIRRADVFAHPSREESFGLVLVEAMAARTAVLAGEHSGGVPWVLDHGRAGVLCDVRRPELIARELLALMEHPEQRRELADRGYARADANFRMSAVARKYVEQYERIV